jgi:hypothetical protein
MVMFEQIREGGYARNIIIDKQNIHHHLRN